MMTPAEIRDAQKALIRGGARIRVTGVLDAPTLAALRAHALKTRPGSEYQPGPTPAIMQGLEPLQSPPANDPGNWMSAAQGLPSGFGDPNVSPQGMSLPGGMGAPNPWDLMAGPMRPPMGGRFSDAFAPPPQPAMADRFAGAFAPPPQASLPDRFAEAFAPPLNIGRPEQFRTAFPQQPAQAAQPAPPVPMPPPQERALLDAAVPDNPMQSQAPIPPAQRFQDTFAPSAGAAQAMPPLAQLLASPEMAKLVGALPARPGMPMPADQSANAPVVEAQSAPATPVRMIRPGRPQMATPEIGDIVAGYRFLGGNPRDKRSWRKL